jgi:hypothetical protein
VRGRVSGKSIGRFTYAKLIDEAGIRVSCEVRVFPLLVKRQSEVWPEIEQRLNPMGFAGEGPVANQAT